MANKVLYRGRLAPSPTGWLHLGHARTFWIAHQRALAAGGELLLRIEDLDQARCKPEFVDGIIEDLTWFGLRWAGEPMFQSQRMDFYREGFERLRTLGVLFPCVCSRQDVLRALQAPHAGHDEPVYPGTCRERNFTARELEGRQVNWRFRVPIGRAVSFVDNRFGPQTFVAGQDFGDFVAWRYDGLPSYHLSVVTDDAATGITEVVRGEDLLRSTARQLLLYESLGLMAPAFRHCELMLDEKGDRLAKRHDSLSLRQLRAAGNTPEEIRSSSAWANC